MPILLIPVLIPLFLSLSKTDPEYIVEKFDVVGTRFTGVIVHRDWIFSKFVENPLDFLQFARDVQAYKPKLLTNALLHCLFEGRCYRHALKMQTKFRLSFTEQQLIAICYELFDKLQQGEREEHICQNLIVDMPPNELLYPKLFEKLWQIESAKPLLDASSAKNFFLIAVNNVQGNDYVAQAEMKIYEWAFGFKTLYKNGKASNLQNYYDVYLYDVYFWDDKSSVSSLRVHANYLMEFVAKAMHPHYRFLRNFALPMADKSKAVTIAINSYWEMVSWLTNKDHFCLLHVLLEGIKGECIFSSEKKNIPLLEEISFKSRDMFETVFKDFMSSNLNEAGLILGVVISRTGGDTQLKNFLDEIFPKFYALSPSLAESAYDQAHRMISYGYRWLYPVIEEKRRLERLNAKKLH